MQFSHPPPPKLKVLIENFENKVNLLKVKMMKKEVCKNELSLSYFKMNIFFPQWIVFRLFFYSKACKSSFYKLNKTCAKMLLEQQ